MSEPLAVGLTGSAVQVVDESSLADRTGVGGAAVFSTPALVALMERAACAALSRCLDESHTSVGYAIEVEHSAPSRPGSTVRAVAQLCAVEGNRLTFEIEAADEQGPIGRALHRRAVVDRLRFAERLRARWATP